MTVSRVLPESSNPAPFGGIIDGESISERLSGHQRNGAKPSAGLGTVRGAPLSKG
jgi:hypothetical protein